MRSVALSMVTEESVSHTGVSARLPPLLGVVTMVFADPSPDAFSGDNAGAVDAAAAISEMDNQPSGGYQLSYLPTKPTLSLMEAAICATHM